MIAADQDRARAELAAGRPVVLVVGADQPPPAWADQVPGQLALMVGDPRDPRVQDAAAAMDRELFG